VEVDLVKSPVERLSIKLPNAEVDLVKSPVQTLFIKTPNA
jgi:hypothetical protein